MARKPTAKPFRLKHTNGKKADRTAFFQMANESMPNPAVDQAINKKMEEKITQKVDQAMSKPGDSPALVKAWSPPESGGVLNPEPKKKEKTPAKQKKEKKNIGKILGKIAKGASVALTHGLDAVYGTGKIEAKEGFFSKKKKEDNSEDNSEE